MKTVHIISGGTMNHIAPHLSLCAPAYGKTGRELYYLATELMPELGLQLHSTKMAGGTWLETNQDIANLVESLGNDANTKIIFMPVAMCDFEVTGFEEIGKDAPRWQTSDGDVWVKFEPSEKIISRIRQKRKDIFLVGFKTTAGASEQEQYLAGLNLLKGSSCNLVLANDIRTRVNMVITPEEARYHVTTNRQEALRGLVEMTKLRSHLTFTRSTVVNGEPVPWSSELVPATLRVVVNHLISRGAYKPFRGATVGHFAAKLPDTFKKCAFCNGFGYTKGGPAGPWEKLDCDACNGSGKGTPVYTFLTSRRKTNFNDIEKLGLVKIETDGPDSVLAYGSKPSVGGQSQRIVFSEHPEYDCIVHAHVPMKDYAIRDTHYEHDLAPEIPVVSQREYECGSHQCGQNTSRGLVKFGNLACVMLDQHGPNIVFHHSINPQEVIDFIEANFDLEGKTGGPV